MAGVQVGAQIMSVPCAGYSDAAVNELPVWTPATVEAFATYGEVDGDGAVVVLPGSRSLWVRRPENRLEHCCTEAHCFSTGCIF